MYLEGHPDAAKRCFQVILSYEHNSLALYNLALVYLATGDEGQAEATYAQAIDEFGPQEARRIGAVDDLLTLMRQGPHAAAALRTLRQYWADAVK